MKTLDHPIVVPRRGLRPGAGFLLALLAGCGAALAQCQPTWTAYPLEGPPRRNNGAFELAVHDEDGPGPIPPALYAGEICMFFNEEPYRTARFDGWAWSTVPDLDDHTIPGAHIPNDRVIWSFLSLGSQPSLLPGLHATGHMSYSGANSLSPGISRFDSAAWHSVGTGFPGTVYSPCLFDEDHQGPLQSFLFIGGQFTHAGGDPAIQKIARFDGQRYSTVGDTIHPGALSVNAMTVFDEDGPGLAPPSLFVGGGFTGFGGVTAQGIARWDGQQWSRLGEPDGVSSARVLAVYDEDGPGPQRPALFIGGAFDHTLGAPRVEFGGGLARWDGQNWSAIPGYTRGSVYGMAVWDDDGPGPNRESLFVSSIDMLINGARIGNIAKWDGQQWHSLEQGFGGFGSISNAETMAVFDEDGPGPNPGGLYVGGTFSRVNGMLTFGFARWGCPLPPRCYADCDQSTGPNQLDAFDFLCFLNRFDAGDPSACDCDHSTGGRVCDVFDFLCFQNHFANGCP